MKKGAPSFSFLGLLLTLCFLPPIATTLSFSPNDIVCSGRQSLPPILLTPYHFRVLDFASALASRVHASHEEIIGKIMKNNAEYKTFVDLHYRLRIFNVGDFVLVRLKPERFPLKIMKKCTRENKTFPNPLEDQSECLRGRPPTKFWH